MTGAKRTRRGLVIVVVVFVALVLVLISNPVAFGITAMRWSMTLQGYEHKYADLSGYRLSYFEKNPNGRSTTILIHGLADQAGTWWRTGDALRDHHVIAVDLPGHGDSGPSNGPITMIHMETMMDFLRTRSTGKFNLVGNSLGGFVALRMTIDHPQRVDRLVAIDAGGMRMSLAKETFLPTNREQMADTMFRVTGPKMMQPPGPLLDDMRESIFAGPTPRIWPTLQAAAPLEDELKLVRVPTLVIWGTEDGLIPIELGKQMAATIPGAVFRSIDGCGHSPQATCPTELVPLLAPFLSTQNDDETQKPQ